MTRKGLPDPEDIDKRTREKESAGGPQLKLDRQMISQYHQDHVIDAYQPQNTGNKKIVKPVGMGIVGTQIDRNVHVLRPKPSARVNAVGGQEAERHVSGKIEPWLNLAVWQSQGDFPVWDTGLLDLNLVGEFVSKVLPAPQFWADDEVKEEVDKLNLMVAEGASEDDIKKQKTNLQRAKTDNWPIVWRYVDPVSTYTVWDERGIAEVLEVRKITRDIIESRFGAIDLPDDLKKDAELEVIEYANHKYVASILRKSGKGNRAAIFLKEPWEHGLRMLPYTFIRFDPVRMNARGHTRRGASYHGREMVQMVDESITDLRTVSRKEVETPLWARIIPRLRAALGLEEKTIEVKEGEPVILLQGEEGSEEIGRVATATVNPNLFALVQFGAEYLDRSGAHRPETIGQGPAGQSAVHLDTARQAQITELSVAHFNAEDGFANICKLHIRAVAALDDAVTVKEPDVEHGSREITLEPGDADQYELLFQGLIKLALPVNRGAAVTNARLLTEARGPGQRPLMSDVAVLQGELEVENPMEMVDSVNEQLVVNALVDEYINTLKRQAQVAAGQLSPEEIAAIAQGFADLPVQAQQALLARFGGDIPPELGGAGQTARTASLGARATRGQQESELGLGG